MINNKARFLATKDAGNTIAKHLAIELTREGSTGVGSASAGVASTANAASASAGVASTTNAASTGVSGASTGLAAMSMSPALLGAVGLTAAVSATLTQVEYQYEKRNIRRLYSEEIAAKLGKSADKVSDKDLDRFAKENGQGNKTIADALKKAKKQRNIGIILSVTASLAALAVVGLAAPGIFTGLGFSALAHPVITFFAEGAMGLFAYNAVKKPMHWVADKLLGMDDKTAHDYIVDIIKDRQEGRSITQQQVMGVFVAAHKELDDMIRSRYGAKYEDLPLTARLAVTRDLSGPLHLQQLTDAINLGQVNATELAFAVEGQASGVIHAIGLEHAKPGRLRSMLDGVGNAMTRVAGVATGHLKGNYPALNEEITSGTVAAHRSFVDRLGFGRSDNDAGFTDRIEQERAADALINR